MINFIVAEDNKYHRESTVRLIMKFMMKNKLDFNILEFSDYDKELKKYVSTKHSFTNIYILDFELPNATAIDIARDIREYDWDSVIIILSAHGGLALETFKQRLQILDFLSKAYNNEKALLELFELAIKKSRLSPSLKYTYKDISYTIPYEKILFIYRDSIERKIIIVTDDNDYKYIGPLNKLYKTFPSELKYCNKGCIINTKRVSALDWKECKATFDNNRTEYILSKNHKKGLNETHELV